MTWSLADKLTISILALDSYNQGRNVNLVVRHANGAIGDASVAVVANGVSPDFEAASYRWNGKTVISYRGTDDPTLAQDILTGWTIGGGVIGDVPLVDVSVQIEDTEAFYQQATGDEVFYPARPDVVLTGHSLGGGLAGYVSALTRTPAITFDNMPYAAAAWMRYAIEADETSDQYNWVDYFDLTTIYSPYYPHYGQIEGLYVSGEALEYVRGFVPIGTSILGYFQTAWANFATAAGGSLGNNPFFGAGSWHLQAAREQTEVQWNPGLQAYDGGTLTPIQYHSMTLAVDLLYAELKGHTDWRSFGPSLWPVTNQEKVGDAIAAVFPAEFAGKMSNGYKINVMIAYSAVQGGAKPYGDAAIEAFFNDANDVGKALDDAGSNSPIHDAKTALAEIVLQYSALLAIGSWVQNGVIEEGVVTRSDDEKTLTIDLAPETWDVGGAPTPYIVGRKTLVDVVDDVPGQLGGSSSQLSGGYPSLSQAMRELYGSPNEDQIGRFTFMIEPAGAPVQLDPATNPSAQAPVNFFAGTETSDGVYGSSDKEILAGADGDDILDGGDGDDIVIGGDGDDALYETAGDDILIGGDGDDVAWFLDPNPTKQYFVELDVDPAFHSPNGRDFSLDEFVGAETTLSSVEYVNLSAEPDIVEVQENGLKAQTVIDMGLSNRAANPTGNLDVVDFSKLAFGINYFDGFVSRRTAGPAEQYGFQLQGLTEEVSLFTEANARDSVDSVTGFLTENVSFRGAEKVILTDQADAYVGGQVGDVVETGGGADKLWFAPGVGVADLSMEDRMTIMGGVPLYGGLRNAQSQNPNALGWGGLIEYGINGAGELGIIAPWWSATPMFILNWDSAVQTQREGEGESEFGPGGMTIAQFDMRAFRILDPNRPSGYDYYQGWELFGLFIKLMVGWDGYGGGDPLVLDLDGDGVETTALNSISARFDIDGDLYAERTALARGHDGMLARDVNGNGRIDDATELFGRGLVSGFAALGVLDGDNDGVISALDDGLADFDGDGTIEASDTFSTLRVWQDRDEDGVTDDGELKTLAELNIVSISLGAAATPGQETANGSRIAATSLYTRADGTTGQVADVVMRTNNTDSRYVGAPITVTPQAEALPDLGAVGSLVTLREAMSNRPDSLAAVQAALPTLDTPDLDVLNERIFPILKAWAEGSPVRLSDGRIVDGPDGLVSRHDVTLVYGDGGLVDYDWRRDQATVNVGGVDKLETTWEFVSGAKFVLVQDLGAATPTFTDLRLNLMQGQPPATSDGLETKATFTLATGATLTVHVPVGATKSVIVAPENFSGPFTTDGKVFSTLSGEKVAVQERIVGESFEPFYIRPDSYDGAIAAMTELVDRIEQGYDLFAVRLAVQGGPLSTFFSTLEFDPTIERFVATSGDQLASVYEQLFLTAGAEADPIDYLKGWKPFLDQLMVDFATKDSLLRPSDGLVAQSVVAAFERVTPTFGLVEAAFVLGVSKEEFIDAANPNIPIESTEAATWLIGPGSLKGTEGGDIVYLSGGGQTIDGAGGADEYIVGRAPGNVVVDDLERYLQEGAGPDMLRFSYHLASDVTASRVGLDLIVTIDATGETIIVRNQFGGQFPSLFGADISDDTGVAEIVFADGEVWNVVDIATAVSRADPASTAVLGTPETDALEGGAGDDVMSGGGDGDLYVIGRGDGVDAIEDNEDNEFRKGVDILNFVDGLTPDDLTFSRAGDSPDVEITIAGGPDRVTLRNQFVATYTGVFGVWWTDRIEYLSFPDITVLSYDDVMDRALDSQTTSGNDVVHGFSRMDYLDAGAGQDFLSGGNEDDTYVFGRGYGFDVIEDNWDNILSGGFDRLLMTSDVRPSDVELVRGPGLDSLTLRIRDTGETVTLQNQFVVVATGVFGNFYFDQIDQVEFDDGAVWTAEAMRRRVLAEAKTAGNDTIIGFDERDTLDGGAGSDRLEGRGYSDAYLFAAGYGHDVAFESFNNILLEDEDRAIFEGLARADVAISRVGLDLLFTILATGETFTVEKHYDRFPVGGQARKIEGFVFTDQTLSWRDLETTDLDLVGTAGADSLLGTHWDETFIGGAGNDTLVGLSGRDVYLFDLGDDFDTIVESVADVRWNQEDEVVFGAGILPGSVGLARDGDDLVLTIGGADGLRIRDHFHQTRYFAIERFRFDDGTVWIDDDVRAALLITEASAGDDTIIGFNGQSNVLDGGRGNDRLVGGDRGDTYVFGVGYGQDLAVETIGNGDPDQVVFGDLITPDMVEFSRSGDDLIVRLKETGDEFRIQGGLALTAIENVVFARGETRTIAEIKAQLLLGTEGDDSLVGYSGADVLQGRGGSDELVGGAGDDVYRFHLGDGQDAIDDNSGHDRVEFGDYISPEDIDWFRDGDTLAILIRNRPDSLAISRFFSGFPIEEFRFADGRVVTLADVKRIVLERQFTEGDDRIDGSADAESFDPKGGDDLVIGGPGADLYVYRRGGGAEIIDDRGFGPGDVIRIEGYVPTEAAVGLVDEATSDIRLSFADFGDEIVIRGGADAGHGSFVETIVFADGTVWTLSELRERLIRDAAGPTADVVIGSTAADTIDGFAGDDLLSGLDGSDLYLIRPGDGEDVVDDNGLADTDAIQFVDRASTDAFVRRVAEGANDVYIGFAGSDDRVLIRSGYQPTIQDGIEEIRFADGVVWTGASLAARVLATAATPGGDSIVGTTAAETLTGGLGFDTLSGGQGADLYLFAAGDGEKTIRDNGLGVGDRVSISGHVSTDATLTRDFVSPSTLVIRFSGSSDVLRIVDTLDSSIVHAIEEIAFADGVTWSMPQVRAALLAASATGGADSVVGFNVDDTLTGGTGADTLVGGGGSDVYEFQRLSGDKTIRDGGAGSTDRVNIRGYLSTEIALARDPADGATLLITFAGTNDRLRIVDTLSAGFVNGVEQIAFDDGVVLSNAAIVAALNAQLPAAGAQTIVGGLDPDTLDGGDGPDFLSGKNAGDTYFFDAGDGRDAVRDDGVGGVDRIVLNDADQSAVVYRRDGADLFISFVGTSDEIRLAGGLGSDLFTGIEEIEFSDGSIVQMSALRQSLLTPTSSADTILGYSGSDTVTGGAGDDVLSGGAGVDAYTFTRGDGRDFIADRGGGETNTLTIHGYLPSETLLRRDGGTLVLTFLGTADEIRVHEGLEPSTLSRIGEYRFDDGTVWTADQVRARALAAQGTGGDDLIAGFSGGETLVGGPGADTLTGGNGSDLYRYARGDGRDVIRDNGFSGSDTISISGYDINDARVRRLDPTSNDIAIVFVDDGDRITILNGLGGGIPDGIETISFVSGGSWNLSELATLALAGEATAGDETIVGTGLDDTLTGAGGRDVLRGGAGADIYEFRPGDGDDRVEDASGTPGFVRLIGIDPDEAIFDRAPPDGDDLVIVVDGADGDRLVVSGMLGGLTGVGAIRFDDGTILDTATLRARIVAEKATDAADRIWGFSGADSLAGGQGPDELYGLGGADAYHFTRGDGHDVVRDKGGGVDELRLHGYAPAEVSVSRLYKASDSLVLEFAGASDRITILNTLDGDALDAVERIVFDSGAFWTMADVNAMLSNRAPVAAADAVTPVLLGATVTIRNAAFVSNDFDPEGDSLKVVAIENGSGGLFSVAANGDVTFVSDGATLGSLSFTYVISDGQGGSASAPGNLRVSPPAEARPDSGFATPEDTPLAIRVATLTANDVDGDLLTVTGVSNAIGGTASLQSNGMALFTPSTNFNGAASFRYHATSPTGGATSALVSVAVTPINDGPTARDDAFATLNEVPLAITPAQLLANDTDPDGDTLLIDTAQALVGGTIARNDAGDVVFTADGGFTGEARFAYTIVDHSGASSSAIARIAVTAINIAPFAVADTIAGVEDVSQSISSATLLANDFDLDSGVLTLTRVFDASGGVVTLLSNGTVHFTPFAHFSGTAGFTYEISDGLSGLSTARAAVQIAEVNDPPTAQDDAGGALTVRAGASLPIAAASLLSNDMDVDAAALAIVSLSDPVGGTATLNADGSVTFAASAGFDGEGGFSYLVGDGRGGLAGARVRIVVEPNTDLPPTAANDTVAAVEDESLLIPFAALLDNDVDPDGDPMTVGGVYTISGVVYDVSGPSGPSGGVLVNPSTNPPILRLGDGSTVRIESEAIRFTPGADFNGISLFAYVLVNEPAGGGEPPGGRPVMNPPVGGAGGSGGTVGGSGSAAVIGQVQVVVAPVNDAPRPVADVARTSLDIPAVMRFGELLANDVDIDSASMTVAGASNPSVGTVEIRGDFVVLRAPAGFTGGAGFDYAASDGVLSGQARITVTIGPETPATLAGSSLSDLVIGSPRSETIFGADGEDTIEAEGGDDLLVGGAQADSLDGGDDNDLADYSASNAFIRISLSTGLGQGGHAEGDRLIDVEGLIGSAFGDELIGDARDNLLHGGGGDDSLFGGAGVDTAEYARPRQDYRIETLVTGAVRVSALLGDEGVDVLEAFEFLRFAGVDVAAPSVFVNVDDGDATAAISGAPFEGTTLSAGFSTPDPDGPETGLLYSWRRDGQSMAGANGASYTLTATDVGSRISVALSYVDGEGFGETVLSAETTPIAAVDDGDAGVVLSGAAVVGETLSAALGAPDPDGGGSAASFRWLRDGVAIAGATGATYVVQSLDIGSAIAAEARYRDGQGFDEAVTSAGLIAAPRPPSVIDGGPGPDTLLGSAFDDLFQADDGDDLMFPRAGGATLDGGDGFDLVFLQDAGPVSLDLRAQLAQGPYTLVFAGGVSSVEGVAGALAGSGDAFTGDQRANWLYGMAGDDTLIGLGGDDLLDGGAGDDSLDGGAGEDVARYDSASARVVADLRITGAQDTGGGGRDVLVAGLDGFSSIEHLVGSNAAEGDLLTGDDRANVLYGLDGDDTIAGGGGDDQIAGGLGNDAIDGGAGFDYARYDDLAGVVVDLTLSGSAVRLNPYADFFATSGFASVEGIVGSNDAATGDLLFGDGQANVIFGLAGADTIDGREGDDQIDSGLGDDVVNGGLGFDYLRFDLGAASPVVVDLSLSGSQDTGAGLDTLVFANGVSTFEGLVGADLAGPGDRLAGDRASNVIMGLSGADSLDGGEGDDFLFGGADADVFLFRDAFGGDQIFDFEVGVDTLGFATGALTALDALTLVDIAEGVLIAGGDGYVVLRGVSAAGLAGVNFATIL